MGEPWSTTVEIILYYLTLRDWHRHVQSTTVEIILYYLTLYLKMRIPNLQQ